MVTQQKSPTVVKCINTKVKRNHHGIIPTLTQVKIGKYILKKLIESTHKFIMFEASTRPERREKQNIEREEEEENFETFFSPKKLA